MLRSILLIALVSIAIVNADEGPFKFYTLPGLAEPSSFAQYTGQIVVNETYGTELFYWFFESQGTPADDPLVLWMTGGPGCSSELAIFYENGPFQLTDDGEGGIAVVPNPYSWNTNANIIFIDQPGGTGFSTPGSHAGYVHNEKEMATDMYNFLQGWLRTFPEYVGRPFFIFGESYAGHYVPSLGYAITVGNQNPTNIFIPLQSISIGNGLTSPIYQYGSYGPFSRAHALINKATQDQVDAQYAQCENVLSTGTGSPDFACDSIWSIISTAAGHFNEYDVTKTCPDDLPLCYNFTLADIYLNQDDVQAQLHVDKKWKECSNLVHQELAKDWWTQSDYLVPEILAAGVYVNVYAGINGYICNFVGQEMWLNRLSWPYLSEYLSAEREIWMVDDIIAGYRQASHGLANIAVNNAGHMVPMDQPKNSLDMFTKILNNQTFA